MLYEDHCNAQDIVLKWLFWGGTLWVSWRNTDCSNYNNEDCILSDAFLKFPWSLAHNFQLLPFWASVSFLIYSHLKSWPSVLHERDLWSDTHSSNPAFAFAIGNLEKDFHTNRGSKEEIMDPENIFHRSVKKVVLH